LLRSTQHRNNKRLPIKYILL